MSKLTRIEIDNKMLNIIATRRAASVFDYSLYRPLTTCLPHSHTVCYSISIICKKVCGLLMPHSAREGYFALRAFNVEIATIKDAASSTSSFSRRHGSFNSNNMDENIGDNDPSFASRLRMRWWAEAISEIFDDVTMEVDGEESNDVHDGGIKPRHPDPLSTIGTTILQSSSSLQRRSTGGLHNNPTLRSLRRAVHEHQLTHRFLRRMTEAREFDLDVVQYDRLRDVAQYGEDTVSNMLYSTLECVGVS